MMAEPVYFVVEARHGRCSPALYYERLPAQFTGRRARDNGLVYAKRVDDQPHLRDRGLSELYDAWELLGGLPDQSQI